MADTQKPRLIIFELRMLGDAVMSLPFIRNALTKYEVFVCCQPGAKEIFTTMLPADHLISWLPPWLAETGKYKLSRWRHSGIKKLVTELRSLKPDIAISVWADTRVHILMALSNAPVRIGFPMNKRNYLAYERRWRKKQLYGGKLLNIAAHLAMLKPLLTRKINRADYWEHRIEDWHQLANELKLPWNLETPWIKPDLSINKAHDEQFNKFLNAAISTEKKIWLLHPGARLPLRRWPVEKFQKLIDTIFTPMNIPLIVVKPPDSPAPDVRASNQILIETPDIPDLIYVLSNADNIICNDSLISHLGAGLGKKVITIFGPGCQQWCAPYNNEEFVVDADVCPHKPCMDRCEMPSYVCMEAVTVKMVQDVISRVISG